jgi:hypothetical protein
VPFLASEAGASPFDRLRAQSEVVGHRPYKQATKVIYQTPPTDNPPYLADFFDIFSKPAMHLSATKNATIRRIHAVIRIDLNEAPPTLASWISRVLIPSVFSIPSGSWGGDAFCGG